MNGPRRQVARLLALIFVLLLPACQGPPGPPGPAGPPGPPGSGASGFEVIDSTAPTPQVVGTFLYSADVLIQTGGHTFSLGAQRPELFGRVELFYTGAGCTGTPFIWAPGAFENLVLLGAIGQANLVFIPDLTAATASMNRVSRVDRDTGACVADGSGNINAKPAIQVFDISGFVPPFDLQ